MSQEFILEASSRKDLGRSASRCLRREGQLPGIIYGAGKEPVSISLRHDDVLHSLENEAFYSSILEVKVDGKAQKVVLKDLQRHAYKPKLIHVDFLRVDAKTDLHVNVPLHFVGTSPAVRQGGVVNHLMNEVEVTCLPKDLPEFIEVNLDNLELDQTVHLSELAVPAGVKLVALAHGNDTGVVSVHLARTAKADEEAEDTANGSDGSAAGEDNAE